MYCMRTLAPAQIMQVWSDSKSQMRGRPLICQRENSLNSFLDHKAQNTTHQENEAQAQGVGWGHLPGLSIHP